MNSTGILLIGNYENRAKLILFIEESGSIFPSLLTLFALDPDYFFSPQNSVKIYIYIS